MSTIPTPPGSEDPHWGTPTNPPEMLQHQMDPPKRRRGTVVLAVTAAVALVAGGGAFALYQADPLNLFRAGPQAAEALPADALFYVGVDLDPSAQQKINALRFLNHFPGFGEGTGVTDSDTDVRKSLLEEALDSADCTGVTYDEDIEPWLGSKFGVAGVAASDGADPDVAFAVEVTDEDAAADGLTKLADCAGSAGVESVGHAFSGDYVILAETQALADGFAADVGNESLAERADFVNDMDSLGDLGIATMWADLGGAIDAFPGVPGDVVDDELGYSGNQGEKVLDLLKRRYSRAAATLRFESDRAEIVASVFGETPDVSFDDNSVVELPDTTVLAASTAGGGDQLAASWDDYLGVLESEGVDVERQLADFEAQTGLAIPADIETVLGDNLMLAVDSDGLTAEAFAAGDPSLVNAGVRFTGDPEALNAIYDKVLALVPGGLGVDLPYSKVDADDGVVIATNDSYADTLVDLGGSLGDSENFQSVVEDGADKQTVVYFNWDSVEDQIIEAAASGGVASSVTDNLEPLRAFGISSSTEGSYTITTVRLSVND